MIAGRDLIINNDAIIPALMLAGALFILYRTFNRPPPSVIIKNAGQRLSGCIGGASAVSQRALIPNDAGGYYQGRGTGEGIFYLRN
jgi:hypothetical protein